MKNIATYILCMNEIKHPKIGYEIITNFGDNARMIIKYQGKEPFEIWQTHH